MNQLQEIVSRMAALSAEFNRYLEPLANRLAEGMKAMKPLLQALAPMVQAFILYDGIAKAREATGWLPYHAVPFAEFFRECGEDEETLITRISSHYEDRHLDIALDIRSHLPEYDIDNEAKATLGEALAAHGLGLYRCTCRVLLPEIERVIREDWVGIHDPKSLKEDTFKKEINKKSLSDFVLSGPQDLVLFGPFANHLFAWVNSREEVGQEAIPNRHAATHGWVSYSSKQHSLNTLILADYVFRLTTSFKAMKGDEETESHVTSSWQSHTEFNHSDKQSCRLRGHYYVPSCG